MFRSQAAFCIFIAVSTCALILPTPAAEPPADNAKPAVESANLPWSFRPLVRQQLPQVKNAAWARDDLDRFILARLEQAGLAPNADADRRVLIRRLAFDLLGLPPSQKEIAAFVNDPAGDDAALARVVDNYLALSHFGERWGRHWLDVVRYADNTGRTWNAPLTYAWRYRDWVIDALNADKPYDRFLTEQIAGDLLPAKSVEQERGHRIATGFLALGMVDLQSLSHEQFVLDVVDDQIDITTRAVLGLSISCARCHDHKYDPVTMRDYYALAGVFYSTRTLPGVAHQQESGGEGYVHPSKLLVLPAADGSRGSSRPPGVHSMSDYQDVWRSGERSIRFTTAPNLAMGVSDSDPRDCAIRIQGEPYERGDTPPRGEVQIPGLPRLAPIPSAASGRLELARWLTSAEQPLTPRVMVNRVWLHLMGAGLVRTVDDFGVNSESPTHPELLDHLAQRFRDDGWSLKRLIRAIVLSRTYRQSSTVMTDRAHVGLTPRRSPNASVSGQEKDPDNTLYWRMKLRRLEWEPFRDALLEVAGRLSLDRPDGIQVAGIGGKSRQSQVASLLPLNSPYRTVYLPVLRAHLPEEYATFDFPDPCLLQGQREVTTVAPQALFLLNSSFVVDCARQAARKLLDSGVQDDEERIDWIYRRVLSRPPQVEETADAVKLLGGLQPTSSQNDAQLYRWTVLIQSLLASAEFRHLR